jgi:hypothetical protein
VRSRRTLHVGGALAGTDGNARRGAACQGVPGGAQPCGPGGRGKTAAGHRGRWPRSDRPGWWPEPGGLTVSGYPAAPPAACASPRSRARTSDSRNRRWPPGVRMLLMRPDAAHRVTVFGSTRKRAATSPGVRRRSLFPSTLRSSCSAVLKCLLSVAKNTRLIAYFRKIGRECSVPSRLTALAPGVA